MTTRILVVAAHPDDEILGMGGTIALHASVWADEVRILCVTDGSSTQYPGDTDRRLKKNEEARQAGLKLRELDRRLVDAQEARRILESQIADFAPETVYAVHPDINLDHQSLFASIAVAARPRPDQPVRRLYTYAPLSSTEWTPPGTNWFTPNWFVDVSETFEQKLEAFACYQTEYRPYPHPRNSRSLRAHAEFFGATVGCEYAEPFVLVRGIHRAREAED